MGFRLLLLIIALLAIWFIVRHLVSKRLSSSDIPKPSRIQSGQMLECHYCHVHVPEEETITTNGHVYCCQEHALKDNNS